MFLLFNNGLCRASAFSAPLEGRQQGRKAPERCRRSVVVSAKKKVPVLHAQPLAFQPQTWFCNQFALQKSDRISGVRCCQAWAQLWLRADHHARAATL